MTAHWIKVEKDTATKPEVMRLAALLEIDEFTVVGHLIAFWSWVDSNLSPECPRTQGTIRGLDRIAGRTGFCEAMIAVGWLSHANGMFEIPKMGRHMGKSAKLRAEDTEKKQRRRDRAKESEKRPPAQGTKSGQSGDETGDQIREDEIRRKERENGPQGQPFIPERMNTPECLKAFEDWCDYLDAAGLDSINPRYNGPQAEAVWKQAHRFGPEKWPLCVQFSIANAYKSIVEPSEPIAKTRAKVSKPKPDQDPEFLRTLEAYRRWPDASDEHRQARAGHLGDTLLRIAKRIGGDRFVAVTEYTLPRLAAEFSRVKDEVQNEPF
jgi:hypothetical protein